MKFYKYKINKEYISKIICNKLSAIHYEYNSVRFYKNGELHNSKNAAMINQGELDVGKAFYLNDIWRGSKSSFTKESWQRFVKMQVFL